MQFIPKNIQWFIRFSACLLALCHSLHGGQAPASLPKVLLIGDSISMAYYKTVVRELEGLAEVSRIPGNGEYTGTGVKKIDEWLGETRWDDVHFNGTGSETLGRQVARVIRTELDARPAPAAPPVEQLQLDFRKLGFGMFLHYNMATYHGKQWVEGYPCPSTFNPGGPIDTDTWADAAKAAGMTYGVLTAKHVAGFCLWDSELTEYDIMHPKCPVQEDIVAKFVKSFTSRGLKAGIYYCWRSPGFADKFKVLPPECDPATHDLAAQIEFQKKQIAELVAKYPDAFYLWNDGLDDTIMTRDAANAWLRSLRPGIIASGNWWDWKKKGQPFVDVAVTETRHFPETNTHPGETCWKLEQGWFWNVGAKPVVTADQIAREIHTAHSRNANFLLNVGPDKQGRILEASQKVMAEIPASRRNQP